MDTSIYRTIHTFMGNTTWLHGVMSAYALWGGLVLLAGMLVGAWWSARRRIDGRSAVATSVLTGIATLVAVGLNAQVISPLIGRVRPCNALAHMTTLLPCNPDYSMPSDHAIIGGAFAAGLWIIDRRLGIVATLLSLLLAFSRVYVGVHYPSDVLVGLVAGALVTLVIYLLFRRRTVLIVEWVSRSRWYRLVAPHPSQKPAHPSRKPGHPSQKSGHPSPRDEAADGGTSFLR